MTDMHHRDIGGLGAALTNENVTCEVICDGLHICDEMLGIYFKVKSTDKFMMVSDCTALSGAPVGKYEGIFEGMALNVTPEGFVLTDTGRLCGSSQPVLFDIRNLVNNVGIPLETCLKMACLNPCIKYGLPTARVPLKWARTQIWWSSATIIRHRSPTPRAGRSMTAAPRARSSMRII